MVRQQTIGDTRSLVDVFLIRIEKGIDCGDDVPRLCERKPSDGRKSVESG
jgi:hypothetical protein